MSAEVSITVACECVECVCSKLAFESDRPFPDEEALCTDCAMGDHDGDDEEEHP